MNDAYFSDLDATRATADQRAMLQRCVDQKNMQEWNAWRRNHLNKGITFDLLDLKNADLTGVNFEGVRFVGARFDSAVLDGACFYNAILENVKFYNSSLRRADFSYANLTRAELDGATLTEADFTGARLQSTHLNGADLQKAIFYESDCQGARFNGAKLQGAKFNLARVGVLTTLDKCQIDKETDFTGVGLDAATIDPGLKAALKNNIRRIHWQKWFDQGKWYKRFFRKYFVRPFWLMTSYGSSTGYVILWFIILAFIFGNIYFAAEGRGYEVINGLCAEEVQNNETVKVPCVKEEPLLAYIRAMYFSVVTMTTLGFGDMYAKATNYWGHILLMLQVLAGYVILGALVTRLGIVFTGEAPALSLEQRREDDK